MSSIRSQVILDAALDSYPFVDSSSSDYSIADGTVVPTLATDDLIFGPVAEFSGDTGCELVLPTASELGLNRTSFTVCAWVRIDPHAPETFGTFSDHSLLANKLPRLNNTTLHLVLRNRKPHFGFFGNDLRSDTILEKGKWYHLAFVYDRALGTRWIFLNGVENAQDTVSTPFSGTETLYIGSSILDGYFHGNISNLRIYSSALNTEQVLEDLVLGPRTSYLVNPNLSNADSRAIPEHNTKKQNNQVFGQTYYLSESSDTIKIQHAPFYNSLNTLGLPMNRFALSIGVRPYLNNADSVIALLSYGNVGDTFWGILLGETTGVYWQEPGDANIKFVPADTSVLAPDFLDKWLYITLEYCDGQLQMFINAQRVIERDISVSLPWSENKFVVGTAADIKTQLGGTLLGASDFSSDDASPYRIAGMVLNYIDKNYNTDAVRIELIETLYYWQGAAVFPADRPVSDVIEQVADVAMFSVLSPNYLPNQAAFQPPGKILGGAVLLPDDVFGKALTFSAMGDQFVLDNLAIVTGDEQTAFIVECWIQPQTLTGVCTILAAGAASGPGWRLNVDPDTFSVDWTNTGGGASYHWEIAANLLAGEWTHVALAYRRDETGNRALAIYINGELAEQQALLATNDFPYSSNNLLAGDCTSITAGATGLYMGSLANLRISASLEAVTEQAISSRIQDDLADKATGSTLFPLEFNLLNMQEQGVLYISHQPQTLKLEISNTGDKNIRVRRGSGNNEQFELHFRPGTLLEPDNVSLEPAAIDMGWQIFYRQENDATDVFSLIYLPDTDDASSNDILIAGDSIILMLTNITVASGSGSRATQVQLRYRLQYNDSNPLEGSRLHYLSVLQMSEAQIHQQLTDLTETELPDLRSSLSEFENEIENFTGALNATVTKTEHDSLETRVDNLSAALSADEDKLKGFLEKLNALDEGEIKEIADVADSVQALSNSTGTSLVAYIDGPAAILNDGLTDNVLKLCIENKLADPIAVSSEVTRIEVTLYFDRSGGAADYANWALSKDTISTVLQAGSDHWAISFNTDDVSDIGGLSSVKVILTPNVETDVFEKSSPLVLSLSGLTYNKPGRGIIRIDYEGVSKAGGTEYNAYGSLLLPILRTSAIGFGHSAETTDAGKVNTVMSGKTALVHNPELVLRRENYIYDSENTANAGIKLDDNGLIIQSEKKITLESGDTVDVEKLHLTGDADGGHNDLKNLNVLHADKIVAGKGVTYTDPREPGNLVPKGAIVMWSGLTIPQGWTLCDGVNDSEASDVIVPDLRDKFIIGAGNKYPIGHQGGHETINIEKINLPNHTHEAYDKGHSHEFEGDNHSIPIEQTWTDVDDDSMPIFSRRWGITELKIATGNANITVKPGGGDDKHQPISILPPYYALCFIIKL